MSIKDSKTAILMMVYHEPEWLQTVKCVATHCPGVPVFFTDRNGTDGLAGAFNHGFFNHRLWEFDYVWFLTNIVFNSGDGLLKLIAALDCRPAIAAITPAFDSDHAHTRPKGHDMVDHVPFVEFTCPLVRASVFRHTMLDPEMPYSGHDLDWGYRVRRRKCLLGVHHGVVVGHTYIRHSSSAHPATVARKALRDAAEEPTKALLAAKYGPEWFKLLRYKY